MRGPQAESPDEVTMTRHVTSGRLFSLPACGLAAPIVFTGAAFAASLKHPGYDHLENFISELGATGAPGAPIMNFAGFLPYGVLIMAFALAIHRGIRAEAGGWLGPTLLALYGLAYVGVALAPCDPGCQATTPSLHHRMHVLLGDFIFLSAVLGPFTLYPRLIRDPAWKSLALATLVLPAAAWLILELSGIGLSGAIRQRLWLLLLFVWIELIAIRLLRLSAHVGPRVTTAAA
jgi:Protein of unknown function (DUF998)